MKKFKELSEIIRINFVKFLNVARVAGYSQTEIGKRTGIHKTRISNMKKPGESKGGARTLSENEIDLIVRAFGEELDIDKSYFYRGFDFQNSQASSSAQTDIFNYNSLLKSFSDAQQYTIKLQEREIKRLNNDLLKLEKFPPEIKKFKHKNWVLRILKKLIVIEMDSEYRRIMENVISIETKELLKKKDKK